MPFEPSDDHMPGRFQRLIGAPLAALFIAAPVLAGVLAVDAGGVRTALADAVRPGGAGDDDDDDALDIGLDTNGEDGTGTGTGDTAFTASPTQQAQPTDQLDSLLTGDSPDPALEPQLDGSPDDSPPPAPAQNQLDDSPDSPPSPEPPAPAQDTVDDSPASPDSPDGSPDS